jgi:hypothetical protein
MTGWPVVQFVAASILGLVGIYTTVQLTQSSQAAAIKTNADRIERLEKESVPKDLFDERTLRILEEQKKLNDRFDKFLERK